MYWAFFSLASGQPYSRQSVREAPAELQSHGEQVQDARECSVYEMTESSANARHEGDEVESRISVTEPTATTLSLSIFAFRLGLPRSTADPPRRCRQPFAAPPPRGC